jgi:hypothetical protein
MSDRLAPANAIEHADIERSKAQSQHCPAADRSRGMRRG